MKTKLTTTELEIIQQSDNLTRYLESLLVGKEPTERSWLYEDLSDDVILQKWSDKLDRLENGSKFERMVFQFDTSQKKKWGFQGGVQPIDEILDEIVMPTFASPPKPMAFTKTREWQAAKTQVLGDLWTAGVRKLRPASYSAVVDDMRVRDTLESNSGWPLFSRRSISEVKNHAVQAATNQQWKDYPAIALFRNYNQKTRLVWMFPMSTNLVEGSYFQPLQSAIMRSPELASKFFAPWRGFEAVRDLVTDAYQRGKYLSASDFSSTDAHFQLYSSLEVCDVMEQCFQSAYRAGLRESIVHMHQIPLVIGPHSKLVGSHGVSSGSNWTNFIETLFDMIFANYVALSTRELNTAGDAYYPKHTGLYAIGDDMSWISNEYDESFAEQLEQYGEDVGQVIKAEKTTNDRDSVKSLQRLFQRGYSRSDGKIRGVYSTIRALKSCVFPERFHKPKLWSSDMFCVRQFMILENCVDHPLFEEFVKFVCEGSRHLPEFAKKTRPELDRALRESKLLPGLNSTYNQERRESSLADFASINIARNL